MLRRDARISRRIFRRDDGCLVSVDEAIVRSATLHRGTDGGSACATRVLVLGCSVRQRPAPVPLPAIERYDGPSFRVLRRFLRAPTPQGTLAISVLSAEHGLILGSQPILPYD